MTYLEISEVFIFTSNDYDDFLKVAKQDDAFIILQKNMLHELDRHDWTVIKEAWDVNEELTELKAARSFCYAILDALGVQVRYKHKGLSLHIEVVDENEELRQELEKDETAN